MQRAKREALEYKFGLSQWIDSAERQFIFGNLSISLELIQNAREVPNNRNIYMFLKDRSFKIQNDGDKPITKEDIEELWCPRKKNEIGQFDEALKLAIGFTESREIVVTTRQNPSTVSYTLTPERPFKESRPLSKLPSNIRTEVSGVFKEDINIKELEDFATCIHNSNLKDDAYKIFINGKQLKSNFPDIEVNERSFNFEGAKLKTSVWKRPLEDKKWNCPYAEPTGVYLLVKGVLINYYPLDKTSHEPCLALINDIYGKVFTGLVTHNKQFINLRDARITNLKKNIIPRITPSRIKEIPNEEMEKNLTQFLRKLILGKNKLVDPILIGRKQTFLWECKDCGYKAYLPSRSYIYCPKCNSINFKYHPERPDQKPPKNKDYEIEFVNHKDYKHYTFIGIEDVTLGRVGINMEDPLCDAHYKELSEGKPVITYGRFLEIGTFLQREKIEEKDLKLKLQELILEDKLWRLNKRRFIQNIMSQLKKDNLDRHWFKDYERKSD